MSVIVVNSFCVDSEPPCYIFSIVFSYCVSAFIVGIFCFYDCVSCVFVSEDFFLVCYFIVPPICSSSDFFPVLPIPLFLDSNMQCILLFLCFFLRSLLRGLELRRGFRLDAELWSIAVFSCLIYLLFIFCCQGPMPA